MSDDINTQMIIVAVTAILSFVTGWGVSILNDKKNRSHTVFSATQSMIAELKAMKKAIDAGTIESAISISESDPQGSFHINMNFHSFHTATYDSMLYSGVFRELEPETQRKIADTYESIKIYNSSRRNAQDVVITLSSTSSNYRDNVMSYNNMIDVILKNVIKNVQELISLLEKKFPKAK